MPELEKYWRMIGQDDEKSIESFLEKLDKYHEISKVKVHTHNYGQVDYLKSANSNAFFVDELYVNDRVALGLFL